MFGTVSTYIFLGGMSATALGGDFNIVLIALGTPKSIRYSVSAIYLPLPKFLIGPSLIGSVFWVFAVLGATLGSNWRGSSIPITRTDLILLTATVVMVRLGLNTNQTEAHRRKWNGYATYNSLAHGAAITPAQNARTKGSTRL